MVMVWPDKVWLGKVWCGEGVFYLGVVIYGCLAW